jgi:hypothetical protein
MDYQNKLPAELKNQFGRVFFKLREAVMTFPAEEWLQAEAIYLRPAGLATHILETFDFYTSELTAEEFPWGERLGADWEDPDKDQLPTQEVILQYLEEMKFRLTEWVGSRNLLEEETVYPGTGETILGRVMYVLRHTEAHLAEMNLELSKRGFSIPEWQ